MYIVFFFIFFVGGQINKYKQYYKTTFSIIESLKAPKSSHASQSQPNVSQSVNDPSQTGITQSNGSQHQNSQQPQLSHSMQSSTNTTQSQPCMNFNQPSIRTSFQFPAQQSLEISKFGESFYDRNNMTPVFNIRSYTQRRLPSNAKKQLFPLVSNSNNNNHNNDNNNNNRSMNGINMLDTDDMDIDIDIDIDINNKK